MEKLRFITIEGGDGAGKSTFLPVIKNYLESLGQKVVLTREPGGTPIGEKLRDMLLTYPMDVKTETLLMVAARAQHHADVINPALEDGVTWVLCDRHADSTYAYQCAAKGFSKGEFRQLSLIAQDGVKPGLTFIFDVPLHIAKERLLKTGKTPDKFESASDDFHLAVAGGFKTVGKEEPGRVKIIDSSKSIEDTKEQVMSYLIPFVNELLAKNENKKKYKP